MSFSKIASIVMYVVVGITLPILILFYFGETLVNKEQYEAKVQKIENPVDQSSTKKVAMDLQSTDSLAVNNQKVEETVANEPVTFTFMEKLVYYKTDIAIVWGYFLLILTAITTIVFPIVYSIVHPANMIRSLLVLVGVAAVIGISYLLASDKSIEIIGYSGTDNSNPVALKLIDTGLIFMYFTLGLALLSILYAEIAKYFK